MSYQQNEGQGDRVEQRTESEDLNQTQPEQENTEMKCDDKRMFQ